ncbi:MAG: 2-dehydropantoate 2-reductase N-terminal domain-containing protein [Oscillospiraceae bacterium]
MEKLRFAILGAGCGGQSMAAILENQGCAVTLMDKNEALVQELKQEEKLTLTGKIELTAPMPACVTTDAAEAIDGADVILVVTTADGHEDVARAIAKTIRPEQIVVLNPGMFCGALAFRTALSRFGCPHEILVAEMADLMFACRKVKAGTVFHSGLKKKRCLQPSLQARPMRWSSCSSPIFPLSRRRRTFCTRRCPASAACCTAYQ